MNENCQKNEYVCYKYEVENNSSFILKDIGIRPQNPLVEFYKSEKENYYFIRIVAIIPSEIKEISVIPPQDREKVKTHLNEIHARTITIKWGENIPPNASTPFNLWSIDFQYSILNEDIGNDKAIHVNYEYGDENGNGDIGTKLSRGTVTTSGTPPASNP